MILDGWGENVEDDYNAIYKGNCPHIKALRENRPNRWRTIKAHGKAVGLPSDGDMGNSEVGHNAMGAGKVINQGAALVDTALETGDMYKSDGFNYVKEAWDNGGTLHMIGLLSDGGVHSRYDQVIGTIHGAWERGAKRVRVHVLTDGRDVPDGSSLQFVAQLEKDLELLRAQGCDAKIASGGGRMRVTMDRYEADWKIVERGWHAHVLGEAPFKFKSALEALKKIKEDDPSVNDQYYPPWVIVDDEEKPVGPIISKALEYPDFQQFGRVRVPKTSISLDRIRVPKVHFAGMMQYDGDLKLPAKFLVAPPVIENTSGQYLVKNGVRTFACSATPPSMPSLLLALPPPSSPPSSPPHSLIPSFIPSLVPSLSPVFPPAPFAPHPWPHARQGEGSGWQCQGEAGDGHGLWGLADMVGHTACLDAVLEACEAVDGSVKEERRGRGLGWEGFARGTGVWWGTGVGLKAMRHGVCGLWGTRGVFHAVRRHVGLWITVLRREGEGKLVLLWHAFTPSLSLIITLLRHFSLVFPLSAPCILRPTPCPLSGALEAVEQVGASIAAAAMDVGVGSLSDPDDAPGLAHFLVSSDVRSSPASLLLLRSRLRVPLHSTVRVHLAAQRPIQRIHVTENTNYLRCLKTLPPSSPNRNPPYAPPLPPLLPPPPSQHSGRSNAYTAAENTNYHGRSNAYTAAENTNYQFDVAAEFLDEALDRFAQFFICPLMSADATNREINAVHSASKELLSPQHPFYKFNVGSLETLKEVPEASGRDIRQELVAFYEKYYSANLMHLVVYGKDSLSSLRAMVESRFALIPNKALRQPDIPGDPCGPEYTKRIVRAVPVAEGHKLEACVAHPEASAGSASGGGAQAGARVIHPGRPAPAPSFTCLHPPSPPPLCPSLAFVTLPPPTSPPTEASAGSASGRRAQAGARVATPADQHLHRATPTRYLGHLIGHEGHGSLFALLKKKGWATALGAGRSHSSKHYAFFAVNIDLTDLGHGECALTLSLHPSHSSKRTEIAHRAGS
ncbi:unnamed protein product, partial [Closterium sp. NIES-64]